MPACPNCKGNQIVKNGLTYYGKQNFKCKACGRQFVEDAQPKEISAETRALVDKMLLEKVPLAGIARVLGVSDTWLHHYVHKTASSPTAKTSD
jgi:transposase-like protein